MAEFDPTDFDGAAGGEAGAHAFDPLGEALEDVEEKDKQVVDPATLRDAVLFAIDCAYPEAMDPLTPGGRSAVAEALMAAIGVLKTKVITSPEDRVGILLYGVREKLNPNGFEGIRLLQELERPSAQRIRQLELEAARTAPQFQERYGYNQALPLADVFWTCTTIFNLSANPKQFHPRLFIFTSNDSPCSNSTESEAAQTRARDLLDLGAKIEFFPIPHPDRPFSIGKFWSQVIPVDDADYVEHSASRIIELERRIRRRIHRKRVLQRQLMEIVPGVEIGIAVHATVIEAKIPAPVYLKNDSNKPLKSDRRQICEQTGAILHPVDDIETYVEVAGDQQRVYVTRQEINELKQFGDGPGLKILGFKSQSKLQPHHRIFHSYFVYPNDQTVTGSSAFCGALIRQMADEKLMAIARYIPRRNTPPLLVALLPQLEQEDPSGNDQLKPPGFNMLIMPWAEEIRPLEFQAPRGDAPLSTECVTAARAVVNSLTSDVFAPGKVENPVLQRHYASVQALALGEDRPEETPDLLKPNEAELAAKDPLFTHWFETITAAVPAPVFAAKRPAEAGFEGAAPKARRVAAEAPTTIEGMREMVSSGEVERLTVSALKDWLKVQGVVCSGKKSDLIDRIRAVL
mmetsp:Transcript_12600/g.23273  ORF Transcript_12600/g.23273 Transcript_12600/m.23273 type:complete len:630 (+) Transcript_12600:76-1965(+)